MRVKGCDEWLMLMTMAMCFVSLCFSGESTDLHIGKRRQFFFDTVIIESIHNITRKVHYPQQMDEPVLQKDKPWEIYALQTMENRKEVMHMEWKLKCSKGARLRWLEKQAI